MFVLYALKFVLALGILALAVKSAIKEVNGEVKVSIPPILAGIMGAIVVMVFFSSFGTIGAGERGVVKQFGAVTGRIVEPGLYMVTPFVQSVRAMNVQVQKEEVECTAVSKDLQQVATNVALNYYPDPTGVADLYKTVGDAYKPKIIDPAIQEAVKAVTAKFTADELIAKRHIVKEVLSKEMTDRLTAHKIHVDAVNVTNFSFTKEFTDAVESKVTATQEAQKAENNLRRVQAEAAQRVAQAQAEAEAIKIQAQAIQHQGGKEYVQLMWIKAWQATGGHVPTYVVNDGRTPFLFQMKEN